MSDWFYPNYDAAEYMNHALLVMRLDWTQWYWLRLWKPHFFPILGIPFLWLHSGNVARAALSYGLVTYGLCAWQLLRLSRLMTFSIVLLVVLLWFGPFWRQLLDWIRQCTVSELAQQTGTGFAKQGLWTYWRLISELIGWVLPLIILLICFRQLVRNSKAKSVTESIWIQVADLLRRNLFYWQTTIVIGLSFFLVSLFIYSGEARYFFVPALLVSGGLWCLIFRRLPHKVSTALAVLIVILNVIGFAGPTWSKPLRALGMVYHGFAWSNWQTPCELKPLRQQLTALIKPSDRVLYLPMYSYPPVLSTWNLNLLLREGGMPTVLRNAEYLLTHNHSLSDFLLSYQHLIVGPVEGSLDLTWIPKSSRLAMDIVLGHMTQQRQDYRMQSLAVECERPELKNGVHFQLWSRYK